MRTHEKPHLHRLSHITVQSQLFSLVGALFILPFILAYTAWSYYVFRGKVRLGEAYQ